MEPTICRSQEPRWWPHFSPSMANVYIGWWEHTYLFSKAKTLFITTHWYGRYIDNLLFIVVAEVTAVQSFQDYLNSNTRNLWLVQRRLLFLSLILLSVWTDKIRSTSYRKSTAGNTTLHLKSCHPKHINKNIPYGEMVRAHRNCSRAVDFVQSA